MRGLDVAPAVDTRTLAIAAGAKDGAEPDRQQTWPRVAPAQQISSVTPRGHDDQTYMASIPEALGDAIDSLDALFIDR